jgi:transcriptional regulator with XRE-family HTH domain
VLLTRLAIYIKWQYQDNREITVEFSHKLKKLRKQKRFTQIELAKMLDVSSAYVSQLELGIRHPSVALIQRIAQIFGVNISYLMDEQSDGMEGAVSDSHIRRIISLAREAGEVDDLEEYLRWKATQTKLGNIQTDDTDLLGLPEDLQIFFRTKKLSEEDRRELASLIRWWCQNRSPQ